MADLSRQSKVDNCDLDKEVEKKSRKRRETSVDRDKYEDDITEIDKRRSSSRSERTKDDKYIDVKHKDGSYGDKYREDSYRDDRHKDEKYWDDKDKDSRRTEDKYYEDDRHRSDKHCEDVDIDNRYKDDKFHQGDDRDYGHRDPKYLDEIERVSRRRDDKYREDSGKDGRHWDYRYQEEGGKMSGTMMIDIVKTVRGMIADTGVISKKDEANRHKRSRDMKYRDESMLRDRPGDRSDAKSLRDENYSTDSISRKSGLGESSPSYDIRISKYKDEQGRRRNNDKDYGDIKSQSCKDQRYDAEKISASGSRLDSISSRGKSSSRVTDLELSSNDCKKRSPASTGHYATRDHYRHLKQDESTNKDYAYQEKGNNYLGDGFAGGYLKSDSHTSLLQLIDKSPSLTSNGRRHVNRFDVRQCLDAEDPTQRSVGSRDLKDFSGKEGKGSRELHIEAPVGDELSQADGDTLSVSSPFIRGGNFSSTTKSSLPPLVRSGVDSPFGFSKDDSRGKPSNRHRRTSDPSIGRFQGNSWK
nr:titin homolog isoform X1 [Ipomoea batatas]GMC97986.1 titin homolog isoform X1 [Ipomoea batatas]